MKTKNLFLGVLAVASLASCSEDKVLGVSPGTNGEEITYSIRSNKMTRASNLYNNDNKPASFYVWAATADGVYIDGDKITGSGDTYTDVTATHYWPSDNGSLDFYATNHEDANLDLTSAPTIAYTVETSPADQEDLLYAVATEQTSETNEGMVSLNFRHALSQIVFQAAESGDDNLYVVIDEVGVHNVYNQGTFTFPTASTSEHQESTASYLGDGTADWSTTTGDNDASYTISLSDVTLTDATTTLTSGETALLLLPQEIELPDGADYTTEGVAYLTLDCAVYNVAGTAYDVETDEQLLGENGETTTVYFPLAINWEAGKRYTYTFSFLTPTTITYSVTVDEFVETDAVEDVYAGAQEADSTSSSGVIDGHEYVDLGFGKWATCNVGATVPADYGDYFGWGEIVAHEQSYYTSSNSTWYGKGATEDSIKGNPLYDAATANWGSNWRTPTYYEIQHLVNQCTHVYTTMENSDGTKVTGALVTSQINGNSIFLPQAGGYTANTNLYSIGRWGYYWTCTPYTDENGCVTNAHFLKFNKFFVDQYSVEIPATFYWECLVPYWAYSIRPVLNE